MTASSGGGRKLGGRGIEQKGKRTHGHGQQGGDCGGSRRLEVEESITGMNGNGKNTIKNELLKKETMWLPLCQVC